MADNSTYEERKKLVDREDIIFTVKRQTGLLSLNRVSLYYAPRPVSQNDLSALKALDEIYTYRPVYGSRRMKAELKRNYQMNLGRDHVIRLMRILNISAIYPGKNTSTHNSTHPVYPYLLRHLEIVRSNQVWSTDITYIRLKHGFCYLVAFIDWYSRYVLSWALSPSLDLEFCLTTLNEAISRYGPPEFANSDQGSHFTSHEYLAILKKNNVKISMDGKGRCLDNIFIERLWRTIKYEHIFIHDYETIQETKAGLKLFFPDYNNDRVHQSLNYRTPSEVYFQKNAIIGLPTNLIWSPLGEVKMILTS